MQGIEKLVPLEPGKVMVIRKVTQNITTLSVRLKYRSLDETMLTEVPSFPSNAQD